MFLDSRASRLIQLADLVAFALFRFYEYDDPQFYELIKHRFDCDGGIEHGLFVFPAIEPPAASKHAAELAALLQ